MKPVQTPTEVLVEFAGALGTCLRASIRLAAVR